MWLEQGDELPSAVDHERLSDGSLSAELRWLPDRRGTLLLRQYHFLLRLDDNSLGLRLLATSESSLVPSGVLPPGHEIITDLIPNMRPSVHVIPT